uniref:DUF659 domain-containing protein n=1 Tax=Romanomermis culicivorax TaxID=13658 RepID=A0A915I6P4_ROMCU
MPRKAPANRVQLLAQRYKDNFLIADGDVLRCSSCNVIINIDNRHQSTHILRHFVSKRHKESSKRLAILNADRLQNSQGQNCSSSSQILDEKPQHIVPALPPTPLSGVDKSQKTFNIDLARAFLQSGISIFKINAPPLRDFLAKYTNKNIPAESTLRKLYIKPLYEETVQKIRTSIGEDDVTFILTETVDPLQRSILNVLVAPLNGTPPKPLLLKMFALDKVDHSSVMKCVLDAGMLLWNGAVKYEKLILLVTSQASHMLESGQNLKNLFTNLNHVTCLAHSLDQICQTVVDAYANANRFIAGMRKVLSKANNKVQLYKDETKLPLPPDATVACWSNWIKCALFYYENFAKISKFVDKLPPDSKFYESIKQLLSHIYLKDELFAVASYDCICNAIQTLRNFESGKQSHYSLYERIGQSLTGMAYNKFVENLAKNPDVRRFVDDDENGVDFGEKTKFAPLVLIDIEETFSQYKSALSDRHRNFQNVEMFTVISYNLQNLSYSNAYNQVDSAENAFPT